ncbi:MAG: glycosyltransferase family 4 protein [Deltaproteobacteria bacterium]|nr:glycosyltransferase family 4 protein [Deltaproteobacteria bacterium]
MKILHLVHNYYPSIGGSQLLIQKLSEGFVARHRDDVTVFTTNAIKSPSFSQNELIPVGDEQLNGVRVRRFPFWRRPLPLLKRLKKLAELAPLRVREYLEPITAGPISPAMYRETERADVDVVGCMSFPFLQMYYPRRKNRRIVLFGALHIRDGHVAAPMLRAIENADAYIAFTQFEADTLVKNGARPDRLHVVGLGVDVADSAVANGREIRARFAIGDAPVVGFIGRQAPHKGCDTLVRAMTLVWAQRPDAYLLLAGGRTAYSPRIDALVAELPADRRARVIVVNDFTDAEKPSWYAACDVFVTVSTDESFGLSFVEAWAAQKPVIGGRIGAIECVIREGEDGLLVPCNDPPALATEIAKLLGDAGLRARLAKAGHAKVRAEHDWPMVVDRIRRIYEGTLTAP